MELGTTGEGERAQPGDSTPRSHTGTTGEEAGEGEEGSGQVHQRGNFPPFSCRPAFPSLLYLLQCFLEFTVTH